MKKYLLIIVLAIMLTACSKMKNTKEYIMPDNLEIQIDANGIITDIKEIDKGCRIVQNGELIFEDVNSYIMPGLCDAHGHFAGLGMLMTEPNFYGAKSPEECIEIAKDYTQNKGQWLYGRGWNHEFFPNSELPTKEILDSVYPDFPVCFRRVDGHSCWVNSKALELANIDKNTPDPQGGKIERYENGEPTGILIDAALEIILNLLPEYTEAEISNQIQIAQNELIKNGLTEIGAIDVLADEFYIYLPYFTNPEPKLRAQVYLSAHSDEYLADSTYWHFQNEYVNVRGIKLYSDGALGSYGAALLEPYSDDTNMMGVHFWTEEEFYKITKAALLRDFDIATHAIGDSANRMVINVYERLHKEFGPDRPLLRIEHTQLLNPIDQKRLVENDIIASMQPVHCTSDAKMAEKRLGFNRCKETGYKWKTLLDLGTKIIAGSDYPIESHNPFTGIDAFVNRIPKGDSEPWFAEEAISIEEAVKCYTLYPRKHLGISDRGIIKVGNKADLTIIDNDLHDKSAIYNTKVIATFINGRQVYSK